MSVRKILLAMLLAAATHGAVARPDCVVDALNALQVPDVAVTEAKPVAATSSLPAYCDVFGTIVTRGEGIDDGAARFEIQLPERWSQRFLFAGFGGNAGTLYPGASPVLGKGYVAIQTDGGHISKNVSEAAWVRKPDGSRDAVKIADFFYRSVHDVTVAGKHLAQSFYGLPVEHAYFNGCSSGGRAGIMEAERYPADFEGVIAGDPVLDFYQTLLRFAVQKAILFSSSAYLSPEMLARIDKIILARCDALDGVKDGIIQDPAQCHVRPESLVCRSDQTKDCINADQARVLHAYLSGVRDRRGRLLYPGMPISDLSDPRGTAVWTTGKTAPDLSHPDAPWGPEANAPSAWVMARQNLIYWQGWGSDLKIQDLDVDPETGVIGDDLIASFDETYRTGDVKDPAKLLPFVHSGRKLILYHGGSDASQSPYRSISFYRDYVALVHGGKVARENVRLFLAPGMQHCGGGQGPDNFDSVAALEDWVERGKPPDFILASTRAGSGTRRSWPLCPYPAQARYQGHGDVNDAANWRCMSPTEETARQRRRSGISAK